MNSNREIGRNCTQRIVFGFLLFLTPLCCTDLGMGPGAQETMTVSGKIEDWALGDTMVIRATGLLVNRGDIYLTEAPVDREGNFMLELGPVPDSLLGTYGWLYNGIIISDTAKAYLFVQFIVCPRNSGPDPPYMRWLSQTNTPICGSSDSICSGITYHYWKHPFNTYVSQTLPQGAADTLQQILELNYRAGWNRQVNERVLLSDHRRLLHVFIDNSATAKWYLVAYREENRSSVDAPQRLY